MARTAIQPQIPFQKLSLNTGIISSLQVSPLWFSDPFPPWIQIYFISFESCLAAMETVNKAYDVVQPVPGLVGPWASWLSWVLHGVPRPVGVRIPPQAYWAAWVTNKAMMYCTIPDLSALHWVNIYILRKWDCSSQVAKINKTNKIELGFTTCSASNLAVP